MADKVSATIRSEIMRQVRSRDTAPELKVRKMLHAAGFRYRLHRADLPGKPDIVFAKSRIAIFVHGCFWHLHSGCANVRIPKSRADYWPRKLRGNRKRDAAVRQKLEALGWTVLIVWECELASPLTVKRRLMRGLIRARDAARRARKRRAVPNTAMLKRG